VSILDRIVERVRERLEDRRLELPASEMRARAESAPSGPSFRAALGERGISLIAEAKRASPSRGVLRDPYDPAALAAEYEAAGARAVSILTERDFFHGAPEHLEAARRVTRLPLLRKDFLVDPYQCWEAKAWGASAALLIVALLDDALLRDLHALLGEIGLDALVEVHTEREAERALALPSVILGVNNRDLATFETDRATTARIAAVAPGGVPLVSESGIHSREHVLEVERAGACAVLVGEALLVCERPGDKIRELVGAKTEGGAP
jgi:indole-3-glycerol phosphate synthase